MSSNLSNKKFRRSFSGTNGEEFHLETYLWESANILRGHVDASDFKAYIFPLLFYKRISDVYDEEYQKALEESDDDEEYAKFEVNHRFVIPDGCHWIDIRDKTKNIGGYLQKTLRNIEKANPNTLYGIFGDSNWGNKEKLTDELMLDLIDHFSKINLSNSKIEPDILGHSYEYLIKRFADLTNKKAGEFYTPRSVVKLMVDILEPNDNEKIFDPAVGTAGMLLEAAEHVKRKNQDVRKLKLYGQEINLNTAAIARINLFLHGIEDFKIIRGDTLREPAFHSENKLAKFDCVIANPPFSLEEWGYEIWKNDPYGRTELGLPPKSKGDFAWLQHMISSMDDKTGRMAIVLPNGCLSRPLEKNNRKKLIQNDLLVAVISLGPNLFYGTTLAPAVLIIKKQKTNTEKNSILLVDAAELFKKGRSQNYLLPTHVEKIIEIYKSRLEVPGISKIVSVDTLAQNNWNVNVSQYIEREIEEQVTLSTALEICKTAFKEQQQSDYNLKQILEEKGFLVN